MTIRLINISDLKLFMDKSDDAHDGLLSLIVEQISSRLESYMNRQLKKMSRTEYFTGGNRLYWLKAFPVDESQTLTVKVDSITQTKDSDYYLWPEIGEIEFTSSVPATKPRNIEVTYTGGYAELNGVLQVPDDIMRACLMQSAFEFRRRKDIGLLTVTMPDGSVTTQSPAKLLKEVEESIKPYRRYPGI
ncbi:MAG: hypothetical protein HZA08_04900 [Nitrospirae bacterium]|nr:hypothetical protein [Nitrospirota bacterium]